MFARARRAPLSSAARVGRRPTEPVIQAAKAFRAMVVTAAPMDSQA